MTPPMRSRLSAAGIHFSISLVLAAAAAALVFGIWYPFPYREISGGRELFLLVIAVDVVMGPLMTLIVFNRSKPARELRRDLSIIAFLQVAALFYGLWTMSVARPVHLVFEIDRFRSVHAVDIPEEELNRAPAAFQRLPWTGPTLLSVRDFRDGDEKFTATMAALQGVPLGARPDLWQDYAKARPQILKIAKPVGDLKTRFPAQSEVIDAALNATAGGTVANRPVGYIPLVGRDNYWTVLLDLNTTEVIAFVPIDSF